MLPLTKVQVEYTSIGSNYNQDALALFHSDGIVKDPTVTVDGKPLMKRGKLQI